MVLLKEEKHAVSLYNMRPSRGMGDINPAKIRKIRKRDGNSPVTLYKTGGRIGLFANMRAKRKRIASGSGEKMGK